MTRTTTRITALTNDRVLRLLVQTGARGSVSWRAVGHVVQTEDGLFASFDDPRFQKVWEHWQAPKPGVAPSDAVVRFAATDGAKQVHIATIRVPQWLVAESRREQRLDRLISRHTPSTGRLPGGPTGPHAPWAAVENNARAKSRAVR